MGGDPVFGMRFELVGSAKISKIQLYLNNIGCTSDKLKQAWFAPRLSLYLYAGRRLPKSYTMDTENITAETIDDLRPYYDNEIPAAMERMAQDPTLNDVVGYAFPGTDVGKIRQMLLGIRTADEFQMVFVKGLLENIIRGTMSAFTTGGFEKLDTGRGHVYISNHRDIVLDGALLQLVLLQGGLSTSEITFGSNLVSSPFVEDFGRSNKMFKIVRGGSTRDLVRNSRILSEHLHEVVSQGRSIWISQRD